MDSGAGTFTAAYDAEGNPTSQTWPNGVEVTTTINEEGAPVGITYTQTGCGQPDCTLFNEAVTFSAHGQWRDRASTLSAQTYGYDQAGRLTTVNDTVDGQCMTRVYGFAGTEGKASNRTSLISYGPDIDGVCQTTTAADTRTYNYDTADRITTAGSVYDALGRTLTTPAADTLLPGNGDATMTYHTNDMAGAVSQSGRTTSYTLDVITNRFRSWTDNATGSLVTRTHHYGTDGDSPAWTDEAGGVWTRLVDGVSGIAAITVNGGTATSWVISNLHSDLVATINGGDVGIGVVHEADEYGQMRNIGDTRVRRYGWLGGKLRVADTASGAVLMGVRLYSPGIGRFVQVDPVAGGSANRYDYCNADPANTTDLDGRAPIGWCSRWSSQKRRWVSCKTRYVADRGCRHKRFTGSDGLVGVFLALAVLSMYSSIAGLLGPGLAAFVFIYMMKNRQATNARGGWWG